MIYPARDERVLRVVRKIVRGLSHFHGVETAVPESRVTADIMRFLLPEGMESHFQHREPDIVEYLYGTWEDGEYASTWLLKFFERCMFIAWVARPRGE